MSEWISVEDDLPDNELFVDVWAQSTKNSEYGIRIVNVLFKDGKFHCRELSSIEYVTHWMPLPDCPKD